MGDDRRLVFRAWGVPRPQGSLKLVSANRGRGRPYLKNSDSVIEWRNSVVACAIAAMEATGWERAEGVPVLLHAYFTFDRPKSHTKRQAALDGGRKASGGDLDKLVRAVGDALVIAGVIDDDKLITDLKAWKRYVGAPGALERPGVEVVVERLEHRPI